MKSKNPWVKRIIYALIALLVLIVFIEVNFPYTDKSLIVSERMPEGASLKILNITDVHSKSFGDDHQRLASLIQKQDFDIITCTGDVVDIYDINQEAFISSFFNMLITLNKPIYYVSGNHEEWKVWAKVSGGLTEKGINVLVNTSAVYVKDGFEYNICGIEDMNTKYDDLDKALANINTENFTILLSHTPQVIEIVKGKPIDLIISGHTHGGQVKLPFFGPVMYHNNEILRKYNKGLFKTSEALLYVDSGLGTTRIPIRFGNRAKITLLELSGIM